MKKLKKILMSIKLFFIRLFCCFCKKHNEKIIYFDNIDQNKSYSNYDPESNTFFNSKIEDNTSYYKKFESLSSGDSCSNSPNSSSSSSSNSFNSFNSSSTFDDSELFHTIDDNDDDNESEKNKSIIL